MTRKVKHSEIRGPTGPGWIECPATKGKHRIHEIACGMRQMDGWGCVKGCPKRKKEEKGER